MRTRQIRTIVFMAIISIGGIMVMQFVWFIKAYDFKQRQFNHTVYLALQEVGEKILEYHKTQVPLMGMVNQISTNYYAVNINGEIENSLLEFLLKTEFEKRNIPVDFEYGIYNCESGKMVYGNYISLKNKKSPGIKSNLPVWSENKYYFSVLFPDMKSYLTSQMGIWLFFNGVLLLICIFFSYALVIILKQKRYSEVQKDFINNMTHELKTPITTILVSTELLKKEEIANNTGKVKMYTSMIEQETFRLKNQVDKVLQVALLDKERIEFNLSPLNLHQCIQRLAKSLQLVISDKGGELSVVLDANIPYLMADEVHLENVIHNLTDNAIKYNNHPPQIAIITKNLKNKLILTIQDNGIGIDEENQKKIFEKFYRVSTGNVHNVKGFGLGLYYVKTIVEKHRGKITLTSELGKGTQLRLEFPSILKDN